MLDRAVEKAAAIVERELDLGAEVSLSVAGGNLPAGSGEAHLRNALRMLALLQPALPNTPPPRPSADASLLEIA